MKPDWISFDNGTTLGTQGSEQGTITCDLEYDGCARITVEKNGCTAPWSFTCGAYGLFIHTAFAPTEEKIMEMTSRAKKEIETILSLSESNACYDKIMEFVSTF